MINQILICYCYWIWKRIRPIKFKSHRFFCLQSDCIYKYPNYNGRWFGKTRSNGSDARFFLFLFFFFFFHKKRNFYRRTAPSPLWPFFFPIAAIGIGLKTLRDSQRGRIRLIQGFPEPFDLICWKKEKRTNTHRKMRESPKVIHRRNSKGIPSTQVYKKIGKKKTGKLVVLLWWPFFLYSNSRCLLAGNII